MLLGTLYFLYQPALSYLKLLILSDLRFLRSSTVKWEQVMKVGQEPEDSGGSVTEQLCDLGQSHFLLWLCFPDLMQKSY